jgi:4'-phosphopantetheinyl transferase
MRRVNGAVDAAAQAPPRQGGPADGEVHVWHGTLEPPPAVRDRFAALLSSDEAQQAGRFRFERDRTRYIAGRAQLRLLLGGYLGVAPVGLAFRYGQYGKPELTASELQFNLSHSGPQMLVAVTRIGDVGVDIELDTTDMAREQIAERFFSPAEVATLRGLPAACQPRAFLACWTRKEAFIKARGDGLQLALDSFDVSLAPGQPVAIVRTAWSHSEPTEWSLIDLSDGLAGYVAAVAVRSAAPVRIVRRALPAISRDDLSTEEKR